MAKREKTKTATVEGDDKPSPVEKDIEQMLDDSNLVEQCDEWYPRIMRAFDNKEDQIRDIEEGWSIYNCILDENQQYKGNTQCYVPIVKDAIVARTQRKAAQLFPTNDRHLSVVSQTGEIPYATISLLEHYIKKTKLRRIVKADMRQGDITGQWNLLVEWSTQRHKIVRLVKDSQANVLGKDALAEGEDDGEEVQTTKTEEVEIEGPRITNVATEDIAILPPTVDSIEDAELVVFKMRLSKEKLEEMRDLGYLSEEITDDLVKTWDEKSNPKKQRAIDAGVKTQGTYKYCLVYCCYANLKVNDPEEGEPERKAFVFYFVKPKTLGGLFENPDWCKKPPLLSVAIEPQSGSVWGRPLTNSVKWLQWLANDFYMMSTDSAQYRMMPIVMTDPLANPNYQTMVMGLAAVWGVDPNKTKVLEFPDLWKDGFTLVESLKKQIWESMHVTEQMMGRVPSGRKNQQQVAQLTMEQNLPIQDEARDYEEDMLEPLMERIFELDTQYRHTDALIPIMGEIGQLRRVEEIPPQQVSERFFFHWTGTDYMQGLQKMQQQVQFMNVLRAVPPQQLNGRKIDVTPILEHSTYLMYGPDLAPRVMIDTRKLITVEAELENEMLANNMPVNVHPGDDDPTHLKLHNDAAKRTGDPEGAFRKHMMMHLGQMQMKAAMAAQQAHQQSGHQGMPGMGGGPGQAGTPRIGANPGVPRPGGQQPPGAISADRIADPMAQPRG